MFRKLNDEELQFDKCSSVLHPEYQHFDTEVSAYLRKYGTGALEKLPTDTRSEVTDERTTDEMLAEDEMVASLGTDELDILMEFDRKKADFEAAFKDIELTKKQSQKFQKAMKILEDKNASDDAKFDAYRILNELKERVTRTRD